jgi:hypothetical protein
MSPRAHGWAHARNDLLGELRLEGESGRRARGERTVGERGARRVRHIWHIAADRGKQGPPAGAGRERHRNRLGAADGRRVRSGVGVYTTPLRMTDIARSSAPFPAVMPKARVRLHPDLQAVRPVARDELRMPIPIEIDGGNVAERLRTADDLRGPGCREPDADDSRIRRIERDVIAASVAVKVRDNAPPGCVRSWGKQERAQEGQGHSAAQGRAAVTHGGQLPGDKLRGERGGLVGQRSGKHEVAVLERLLRLIHEALRLIVLRARVGVQFAVIDA